MRIYKLPTSLKQEFAVSGRILWMNISCKLKRTPCSFGQIDVSHVCIALGNTQYPSRKLQLLPLPLRHRAKRRIYARIAPNFPHTQVHKPDEFVPSHTQRAYLPIGSTKSCSSTREA